MSWLYIISILQTKTFAEFSMISINNTRVYDSFMEIAEQLYTGNLRGFLFILHTSLLDCNFLPMY